MKRWTLGAALRVVAVTSTAAALAIGAGFLLRFLLRSLFSEVTPNVATGAAETSREEAVLAFEEALLAIRQDLGHSNKHLTKGDLSTFIRLSRSPLTSVPGVDSRLQEDWSQTSQTSDVAGAVAPGGDVHVQRRGLG